MLRILQKYLWIAKRERGGGRGRVGTKGTILPRELLTRDLWLISVINLLMHSAE